ncbi:unnamed protein product [Notodromas monacha]|uniref:Glutamate/phenylalanine/leucine/valine/L-tryptophan dehydrogenase dimerisation domain-containing protein n=1 Tax=Notodromas monacha TaxID=399045 RepID=A0A7R9BG92_9CRUS|nr:unnamed protein product [Notodromas monacha]CAG0913607.1 unnamed protein product [Notodromas monacha]
MRPCHHIIEINFPIKRDNGKYKMIQGFRAQHSQHPTPCKGELKLLPALTSISNQRFYSKHEIPEHLRDMPEQSKPSFFEMVEYFFHKGWQTVEEKLVDKMPGKKNRKTNLRKFRDS